MNITKPTSINSDRQPKYFDIVAVAFVSVYLITQVSSTKIAAFGPFQFPGAIILFPFSYIFGDVLTEVYGYARTRRVIWMGFIAAVLLAVVLMIVEYLPPAPGWQDQSAYTTILGFVPRIVLGSIFGYWVGEFGNSFVMSRLKVITKGRHLWMRTISSTVVGQALDTLVFVTIAFGGRFPIGLIVSMSISAYLFKVAYETIATPLTYIFVNFLKRREGIDVFDDNENYTPFRF